MMKRSINSHAHTGDNELAGGNICQELDSQVS